MGNVTLNIRLPESLHSTLKAMVNHGECGSINQAIVQATEVMAGKNTVSIGKHRILVGQLVPGCISENQLIWSVLTDRQIRTLFVLAMDHGGIEGIPEEDLQDNGLGILAENRKIRKKK